MYLAARWCIIVCPEAGTYHVISSIQMIRLHDDWVVSVDLIMKFISVRLVIILLISASIVAICQPDVCLLNHCIRIRRGTFFRGLIFLCAGR